jgi:molybdate transport system substrate-binding protein
LEIAVPKGSTRVRSLADLSRPGLNVALCAAVVPCGHFADEVLAKAHVSVRSPSREEDVKAVLTKVGLGEADAGVVYTSDVATSPRVDGVAIPAADNVVARYPIATLTHARNAAAARAFVALVLSSAGRDVLRRYGFRA